MANNYGTQLLNLLSQRGKTADPTKLTTDQIELQKSSNPLFGFGFKTAQDKQAEAIAAAQQAALMQQADDANSDYYAAQDPLAYGRVLASRSGRGFGRALANYQGSKNPAPQQDMTNDPVYDRLVQLTQEFGDPDKAMLFLGRELVTQGDQRGVQMVQQAQDNILKKQKAVTEQGQNELALRTGLKDEPNAGLPYKIGQIVSRASMDASGRPITKEMRYGGRKPDGTDIWEEVDRGVKGSVQGPNDTWGTNATIAKTREDYQKEQLAAKNLSQIVSRMREIKAIQPASTGYAPDIVAKFSDITGAAKDIGRVLLPNTFSGGGTGNSRVLWDETGTKATVASVDKYNSLFESMHINGTAMRNLTYELAFALIASTQGPNTRPTDDDFRNALKEVGQATRDDAAWNALIDNISERAAQRLENSSQLTLLEGTPIGQRPEYMQSTKEILDSLRKNKATAQPSNTNEPVRLMRGGKSYLIPSDKVEKALSEGFTHG